jgi:chemotaxis protein MotB
MGTTNLGQGLLERSGLDYRAPAARQRVATAGSATPWVLLVFALAAGGYFSYDFLGRAQNARAAADRAEAELKLTRQRAFEAEQKQAELSGQLAALKADNDRLQGDLGALGDARKKVVARPAAPSLAAPAAPGATPDVLATELARSVAADEGELTPASGKLTLDLADKALWKGAKAELSPGGKKLLHKLGDLLNKYPDRAVWVVGQTDAGPMKGAELAASWTLSTTRSLAVVRYLVDEARVDPRRLTAAGSGPARMTARAKARHRRLALVVWPADAAAARP